jgi:Tfp pilus assembly protein PilW
MDCKLTSIKFDTFNRQVAMTLVETLVAMAAGFVILGTIGILTIWSARSFGALSNYVDLDNASRLALDQLTRDIRQVKGLVSLTTNQTLQQLEFEDSDEQRLYYRFSPGSKTLTKVKNGVSQILLRDCDTLSFTIFQRNNISGTYDQYDVVSNNMSTCKLVQVSWVCSRKLLPTDLINSESVQTAKIVLRAAQVN